MLKPISPDSSIFYIGVDDTTIDLFENQYPVPHGISYNAYAIRDEKTALPRSSGWNRRRKCWTARLRIIW